MVRHRISIRPRRTLFQVSFCLGQKVIWWKGKTFFTVLCKDLGFQEIFTEEEA